MFDIQAAITRLEYRFSITLIFMDAAGKECLEIIYHSVRLVHVVAESKFRSCELVT